MYQQNLKNEGMKRKERTLRLRNRIKEIRCYLIKINEKEVNIMQNLIEAIELEQDTKTNLNQLMDIIDDFEQCLYHLKMIFLSSECFHDKCIELIDVMETDLKGCLKICDTIQSISNKNKVSLAEGVHEIFQKHIHKIYNSTDGLENQDNFEYAPNVHSTPISNRHSVSHLKPDKTMLRIGDKVLKCNDEGDFFLKDDINTTDDNIQSNTPKLGKKTPPKMHMQKQHSGSFNNNAQNSFNTDNSFDLKKEYPREFLVDKTADSNSSLLPGT